uniref:Uncharacterized protein n=1 Tax=Tanacetum cinerariifolium TaxID=118510 RepID=A0A6L2LL41_TANCI|nr:hypothetical protein [Tanacetum cinerariifolium]
MTLLLKCPCSSLFKIHASGYGRGFCSSCLKIKDWKEQFRLLSDIKSKESTLQLIYDVLHLYPFFKAFLVTTDVPEIYMQEFWATATVHHHVIRFKMDNKKHIVNLESFRDMLHICLRVPGQSFAEPLFEEDILAFVCFLGHNAAIRMLTDVEHKNSKKSNEMYYPRFTKVIIHHFMSKDPSILRRNKFGALLPIELTSEEIRNTNAYKEYYAVATEAAPPKPKASVWKTRSSFDTSITPPNVVAGPRLTTSKKGKQTAKASKAKSLYALSEVAMTEAQQLKLVTKRSLQQTHISQASGSSADEGTGSKPGVLDVPTDKLEEELSWNSTDEEGDDVKGKDDDGDDDDEDDDGDEGDDDDDQEVERDEDKDDEKEGGDDDHEYDEDEYDKETRDEESLILSQKPLKTLMMKAMKIIKEQVNEQVKVQVSNILPRIEQTVNEQLEAKVFTRSSHSSKTSYAVAVDLSEMELKKILIKKMEGNKSIQRSDEQRNLYKALVEAYESDKIILDTYREIVTLKRRRDDDADKDEEPSIGPDWGLRDAEKERSLSQQALPRRKQPGALASPHKGPNLDSELTKQTDPRSSFNELMDTPLDFSNFLINRLKVDTLTPELLAGPTYELMKGSCKSLVELEYHLEEVFKATTDQLDRVNPEGTSSRKYTTSVTKTKATDYRHIKWIKDLVPRAMWIEEPIGYDKHALWGVSHWGHKRQQFYNFSINRESARDVYSKRRIIAVNELKIVEWHNYKHLDWITVRRDDDKLYKFKEGDFKRLRIQDIEDMLLLLVQGKLTNLIVEERFAFNFSLCMFTRSIVIQRRVEDLQWGIESYQKKLNLTKPDTYRSDLKRKEAYTAYSNPKGFIYQNKDKKNRLMWVDELHKFSNGTLTDVRTMLDDRLKGIRMKYLPQSIWRKSDKEKAAAMIQAIDKRLKTRRIMMSLERSILMDLQVTSTKPGRITKPYSSHRFIDNCYNAGKIKMEVKVPGSSSLINS